MVACYVTKPEFRISNFLEAPFMLCVLHHLYAKALSGAGSIQRVLSAWRGGLYVDTGPSQGRSQRALFDLFLCHHITGPRW